ncbi:MAG: hypothetical protein K2K97_10815, partial [Muribaculaceae bacterium]|nr:hypothetical protein [Muribaculaceae bacterium]
MKTHIALALALLFSVTVAAQTVNISAFPDDAFAENGILSLAEASQANMTAIDSIAGESVIAKRPIPVSLTAEDFITKVYGVLSPGRSKNELCEDCANVLNLIPSEDNMGLWLDSADGYQLNYYGQTIPDVSAMAAIESDSVANFGFFFLFPYTGATKDEMCRKQALFCGSLLQEMQDIGAIMGVNAASESLFEACGDYQG